jgi:hypothetical protein
MCELCEEVGGAVYCQDCGRIICLDFEYSDDVCAPAYITASGDLFCNRCGREIDEAEEYDDMFFGYEFDLY